MIELLLFLALGVLLGAFASWLVMKGRVALAESQAEVTIAELKLKLQNEQEKSAREVETIRLAREEFANRFEVLANRILEEKSKKFTDQNRVNLGHLLTPFQENINAFRAKVEEVYVNEGKDRSALAEQVKMLASLNHALQEDTRNLTLALRGDRKALGNWGEIILDDVLEKAGLVDGQHYIRQGSIKDAEGKSHVIPDVVINLPGNRHLVIDSKMTLPDYRAFADAATDREREDALKRHLLSIRNHIKGLSEKNYHSLYGLQSMDFVVMFMPLEPAFLLAITHDPELFQQAWEKNVLIVSPSTLLFVIRTVAHLWRQEDLGKNAQEISRRGAELYDRMVAFVAELNSVGERLQQAQTSYLEAKRKFCEGKGNVIRQAEMLKQLGVKPSRNLPEDWRGEGE